MHRHRQERWLHTRISPHLEDALKREARKRRTPVSLLVRNVLEGALDLVEEIVEDSLDIAKRSRRFAQRVSGSARRSDDGLTDVYGWQEIVLNRAAECAGCAASLGMGSAAHRGLRERPGAPVFICAKCLRQLRRPAEDRKEEKS